MELVTVTVGTYNSSKFILETLDSIFNQSYSNIELIIGDDASTDDTMEKVKSWLAKDNKRKRFHNVKIIEVEKNTGPTGNANRKLKVATGEWIKGIAADDTLMPDCIRDNMEFVSNNPEARVLFSKINLYNDTFDEKNYLRTTPDTITPNSIVWPSRSAESQYKMLLIGDRIHFTPSVFWHRETLISVGGFDERFKYLEDYPLWLNFTRNGYKLYFMDRITVNYRRHAQAINNTGINYMVNPNYFRQEEFRKIYTYPNLPRDIRRFQRFNFYMSLPFKKTLKNRDTPINRRIYSFLTIYINPFKYFILIRKRINKKLRNNEFYI